MNFDEVSAEVASPDVVMAATLRWLEKAVIGLNLCPFAKAVQVKQQIRYVISSAHNEVELLQDLQSELEYLAEAKPQDTETTLLIHPYVLNHFLDYNDFLDVAEALVAELDLEGELQIASFHPDYQFANTSADDIENYSNRSPYPILHLLRESSITQAVETFPDVASIYERNKTTLKHLGVNGWRALLSVSN